MSSARLPNEIHMADSDVRFGCPGSGGLASLAASGEDMNKVSVGEDKSFVVKQKKYPGVNRCADLV